MTSNDGLGAADRRRDRVEWVSVSRVFATDGRSVHILDVKERTDSEFEDKVESVSETIRSNLEFRSPRSLRWGRERRARPDHRHSRDGDVLESAEWVFEALPRIPRSNENSSSADALGDAVVATTTSDQHRRTGGRRPAPERLLITHWLNPAFIVPLVEVAHNERTDDDAVDRTVALRGRRQGAGHLFGQSRLSARAFRRLR